jgi:copper chaperone CopZ
MKTTISIGGMHCKSCESLVKDELLELGVEKCEINIKTGKTILVFDESKIKFDSIISVIMKLGYKATKEAR